MKTVRTNTERANYAIKSWDYTIGAMQKYFKTESVEFDDCIKYQAIVSHSKSWFFEILSKLPFNVSKDGSICDSNFYRTFGDVLRVGVVKKYEYHMCTPTILVNYSLHIKGYLNNNTAIAIVKRKYTDERIKECTQWEKTHYTNQLVNVLTDILNEGKFHGVCREDGIHANNDKEMVAKYVLDTLGFEYTMGNDAPRGGKTGSYIELTEKGRKQVEEYINGGNIDCIDIDFENIWSKYANCVKNN